MSIRAKLIVLVSALLVLMLFLGVNGLMRLASTNAHFATTYNDRVVPLNQLKVVADMYAVNIVDTTPARAHIRDKGANNRAENSHQPTRLRERHSSR